MGNDWFHEYFINELKAIGRKPTSNMQHEVVDSLPSSGNEQTIYFVKNDSSSSNNHYDEYVWISSSSTFEKIGSTQIDGSTTQPDWNQNDETAADYVKNRPFYTGDPVETVLVEETTVAFADAGDGSGMYAAVFPSTVEVTAGETYKVSWDGTVYECACVLLSDAYAIGNLSMPGIGPDTGEPFLIGVRNGESIFITTVDTSASHTISISERAVPVVKIDKKYLAQPDWNQNDETAADYVKNRPFYSETGTVTVENAIDGMPLERFPVFSVGDTVTVNVDGVEHSLVAYDDEGLVTIGDTSSSIDNGEGQLGWQIYVNIEKVCFGAMAPHTVSYLGTDYHHKIDEKYLPDTLLSFKPAGKSYLTFSSPSSFTLAVNDRTKHWNGILEYFASDKTWTIWDGISTLSAVYDNGEYLLYLRGTSNIFITGFNVDYGWVLTGADIKCIGNIENLLDYGTVESGVHPKLANNCYAFMFQGCTSLTQAPALPATTLATNCYLYMFQDCTSLTQAPALPATTLADSCYKSMFQGCTSLTQAPALPATTLTVSCYAHMFQGCTSLIQAPALPATTLANSCYESMFQGCTSLTQAPALPATTLANSCYNTMFIHCSSLTQAPALPATTLANSCYHSMFMHCTSLTQAPALPATTLEAGCYRGMFQYCTSLKLSSTKTDEYTQEYRVPFSGNVTTAVNALTDMFTSTGGTYAGTPSINTTYYLSSDNMIVRETDIATLNGYVGSMIDAALSKIGVAEEGAY